MRLRSCQKADNELPIAGPMHAATVQLVSKLLSPFNRGGGLVAAVCCQAHCRAHHLRPMASWQPPHQAARSQRPNQQQSPPHRRRQRPARRSPSSARRSARTCGRGLLPATSRTAMWLLPQNCSVVACACQRSCGTGDVPCKVTCLLAVPPTIPLSDQHLLDRKCCAISGEPSGNGRRRQTCQSSRSRRRR